MSDSPWTRSSYSGDIIPVPTQRTRIVDAKDWDSRMRQEYQMRCFDSGATRDTEDGKMDYEGFLSPLVLERFARYMHAHREQADGQLRGSDNWQKGIPCDAYMKSLLRHVMDVWKQHRGLKGEQSLEESLCGCLFNIQGYLFEILKEKK